MRQAEAARVLGVSRAQVHKLLGSGKLTPCPGRPRQVEDASVYARLNGEPRDVAAVPAPVAVAKRCTSCGVVLTENNTYLRDGRLYSRCSRCHTRTTMYDQYRKNAEKRGLTFNLTRSAFAALTHEPCMYCGGTYYKGYNGIDRINSKHGYEPWNVAPACKPCNLAKNNLPVNEWVAWLKRIKAAPLPQTVVDLANAQGLRS